MHQPPIIVSQQIELPKNKFGEFFKRNPIFISILQAIFLVTSIISATVFPFQSSMAKSYIVTNTQDSGDGSLRQAILNLNAECAVGGNTIIFNIPAQEPVASNDNSSGKVVYSGGSFFRIVPLTPLPKLTCAGTVVDGTTQTVFGGDTNFGTSGTGNFVGVDQLPLSKIGKPEIEIKAGYVAPVTKSYGLEVSASNVTIKGLAVLGFGKPNESANIGILCCTNLSVTQNFIGSSAKDFQDPGGDSRSQANGIYLENTKASSITENLIGFHGMMGVFIRVGETTNIVIQGNEIRENNREQGLKGPGIGISESSDVDGLAIKNNLIIGHDVASGASASNEYADFGIELTSPATGKVSIENNTLASNSTGAVLAGGSTVGFIKNLVFNNKGKGLMVTGRLNTISKNSFYSNDNSPSNTTSLAIDLDPDLSGVTLNDSGDMDSGGNDRLNFPILQTARISGGNLNISGFVRSLNTIELFISDPDPSGFGEGKTYLVSLKEGSSSDLDSGIGSFGPDKINGLSQGSDTANKFSFSIPLNSLPISVSSNTPLTATATDPLGNTSEFSGNVSIASETSQGAGQSPENSLSAVNDQVTVTRNSPATFNVLTNDTDPEGDSFTLFLPSSETITSKGNVSCTEQGSCTYIPKNNQTGTDSFFYGITDVKGAVSTATVSITIQDPSVSTSTAGTSIAGQVFLDKNKNGTKDLAESGASNIPLTITDSSGSVVSISTDASGKFLSPVKSGVVTLNLNLTAPATAGFEVTTKEQGGSSTQIIQVLANTEGLFSPIGLYNPSPQPELQKASAQTQKGFFLGLILLSGVLFLQYWKLKIQDA